MQLAEAFCKTIQFNRKTVQFEYCELIIVILICTTFTNLLFKIGYKIDTKVKSQHIHTESALVIHFSAG